MQTVKVVVKYYAKNDYEIFINGHTLVAPKDFHRKNLYLGMATGALVNAGLRVELVELTRQQSWGNAQLERGERGKDRPPKTIVIYTLCA